MASKVWTKFKTFFEEIASFYPPNTNENSFLVLFLYISTFLFYLVTSQSGDPCNALAGKNVQVPYTIKRVEGFVTRDYSGPAQVEFVLNIVHQKVKGVSMGIEYTCGDISYIQL